MDTEHNCSQAGGDSQQVAEQLLDIVPRLRSLMAAEADAVALTMTQLRVLALLKCRPRLPSELARELRVTPATVSEVVDLLVRRGLVERGEEPEDRRSTPLRITSEGLALLEAARGRALAAFQRLLARLDPADLARLASSLAALQEALRETGGGRQA